MANVAFIGLGIMGKPMAGHLLAAGHRLSIYTRTKSKANDLMKMGALWADSPAAAVGKECDFAVVCVTNTDDVKQVVLGEHGIIDSARRGLTVIDHSTISPMATREMHDELKLRGTNFIDAPVSGGDVGAKNATLSIMCGGDENAFDRAQPILKTVGKQITYCGPSGNGQLTKLVNQILVSVTNMAVCEALIFAKMNKLDLKTTLEAVSGGAAASWQLTNLGPKMVDHDNRPGFMVDLQQKDLHLVMDTAEESNTSLPATSLVHQLFAAAQAAGHGRDGTQSLFTVLEKLAATH